MAKIVLTDAKVSIGTVDLSDCVTSIDYTQEADDKETTTFGAAGGWRTRVGGLKQGSVTIDFLQDYATGKVHQTINGLLGTIATVTVQPASGTATASNPQFVIPCLVTTVQLVNGAVGDLATESITWPTTGTPTVNP